MYSLLEFQELFLLHRNNQVLIQVPSPAAVVRPTSTYVTNGGKCTLGWGHWTSALTTQMSALKTKATKHLKSHLVTRFLIGNKKRETRRSRYLKPTTTVLPQTAIKRTRGQMRKHQELAQDSHKWYITFTSNTTFVLRFSSYYIIYIKSNADDDFFSITRRVRYTHLPPQ